MFDSWGPTRYEKIIYNILPERLLAARLSGIARAVRITHEPMTSCQLTVNETACGVVAPLVCFYAWWLLRCAVRDGIKRIYFLARDGQLLLEATQILIERWNLDIDARYLYCSRESLLLPSYEQTGEFELHWITWGYAGAISMAEISRRISVDMDEMRPYLYRHGLDGCLLLPEQPMQRSDIAKVENLLKDAEMEQLIRRKSEPQFKLTLAYLEQERLFEGVPWVLADTGWRGSSQYALSALMSKAGKRSTTGLTGNYLGINLEAHQYGNDSLHAFLFDWRISPRDYRLYCFICFEMLFSADHGRTIGYRRDGDIIAPILTQPPLEYVGEAVDFHHRKTRDYASLLAKHMPIDAYDDSLSDVSRSLACSFITTPSSEEAALYGEWPIASEMGEADFQPMSPPMGFVQFIRCAMGLDKIKGFWPQASLVRGNQHLLNGVYNVFLDIGVLDWYRRFLLRY